MEEALKIFVWFFENHEYNTKQKERLQIDWEKVCLKRIWETEIQN